METIKKHWKMILGALAAVAGVFLYSRNKQLEGEALTAETDKEGVILETKREAIIDRRNDIDAEKTAASARKDDAVANASSATPSEVSDFYKKKLND